MQWFIPAVFTLALVTALFFNVDPVNGAEVEQESYYIQPEEPIRGKVTIIELLVVNDSSSLVMGVRLRISQEIFDCILTLSHRSNQTQSIDIYKAELRFVESGNLVVTEQHLVGSQWSDFRSFNITVHKEKSEDNRILGLPDWYCSIGVLILTITIIFITWAYFRGRRIQRGREVETPGQIKCSDCGRSLAGTEETCPFCGIELTGEEFLCGKCGKIVGPSDERCGSCGSRLGSRNEINTPKTSSERPSIKKKRQVSNTSISDSIKRTCDRCGTVILKTEITCPICGKLNR